MTRNSSHRKSRRNARSASQSASPSASPSASQDSPRPQSSKPTTPGSSGPQSPWSSGFEEQGVTGLPSPPPSQSPSLGTSSPANVALSSGISTPSIEEYETSRSATPIEDIDAHPSTTASQSSLKSIEVGLVEDKTLPNDQNTGYVVETIYLRHSKAIWSCFKFILRHWRVIASFMYATAVIALFTGIYYFDETNDLLTQYDLPTLPSLDDINAIFGYEYCGYFIGISSLLFLGLTGWYSIEWRKMASTETRRFVTLCFRKLRSCGSWILRGITYSFHTLIISPLIGLFWYLVSIPVAGMWWFIGLLERIIIKGNKICRRRVLVILIVLGGGIHWVWERSHPLNAIEQLAAFAERHRDDDMIAFCIFKTSYYVAYYYFAFAKYLFPAKYEYNIWNDPVVHYIILSVAVIIISTWLIGKAFDWIMQSGITTQKVEADIRMVEKVK
ncbi:uncharacterized protein FMAN_15391 [Fusarium mangiferae]|uniref:Uncharacterized protein n=1 Tax=Fusarium mangiferae TaxID=192010 RepID=A0A1L7UIK1_FUSMA|nr:uncharacterized protein FMAN_15391 [Fusarium mangiferae]CVL07321.1 uncharacterized protein FMAN_15391 [Fusarium mangiferae]